VVGNTLLALLRMRSTMTSCFSDSCWSSS
jgi:hypothetical protein